MVSTLARPVRRSIKAPRPVALSTLARPVRRSIKASRPVALSTLARPVRRSILIASREEGRLSLGGTFGKQRYLRSGIHHDNRSFFA